MAVTYCFPGPWIPRDFRTSYIDQSMTRPAAEIRFRESDGRKSHCVPAIVIALLLGYADFVISSEPDKGAAGKVAVELAGGDAGAGAPTISGLTQAGIVNDDRITEASGLAASGIFRDACWMHNDSGDEARLFLVSLDGATRAVVELAGQKAYDWEDMCSFTIDGVSWLLVADIGDNARKRGNGKKNGLPACQLLLLKELPLPGRAKPGKVTWNVHATIEFSFEDGPRDCESVAVDTTSKKILLLSKSFPLDCGLYELPLNLHKGNVTQIARRIAKPGVPFATAMDISPQGDRMVIASMLTGALIERRANEDWAAACQRPAVILQLPVRKQGETVCFMPDGNSILLNSEGRQQPLWKLELPKRP